MSTMMYMPSSPMNPPEFIPPNTINSPGLIYNSPPKKPDSNKIYEFMELLFKLREQYSTTEPINKDDIAKTEKRLLDLYLNELK